MSKAPQIPESGIVHRVEPWMDRTKLTATTYQLRNFYQQFGDGFFSVLDVMNYIQHQQIVHWCRKGQHVLDVCCGRGLLLPMLRYERKDIASYTGVDLEPKNAIWQHQRVTDGAPIPADYYPFPTRFVAANAADMAPALDPQRFDIIVYTSAIEHMQQATGQASLHACRAVSKPGTLLFLTCPNTPEDKDGYDTQYAAHIYEWKRSELLAGLTAAGFFVVDTWGLLIDRKTLLAESGKLGLSLVVERLLQFVPSAWLLPVFAPLFPAASKEIGIVCRAV